MWLSTAQPLGADDIKAAVQRGVAHAMNEVEYLEYRQYEIEQIAKIFRVPMHLLGPIP
jgi:hypothetical protein